MHLDVLTIQALDIAVTTVLGAMLAFTWLRERDRFVGLWGLAMFLQALGIVVVVLASLHQIETIGVAGTAIMLVAEDLKWRAARQFAVPNARFTWPHVLIGPGMFVLIVVSGLAEHFDDRMILFCTVVALYNFAVAAELARADGEELTSRWMAVALLIATGIGSLSWVPFSLTQPISSPQGVLSSEWFAFQESLALLVRVALAFIVLAIAKECRERKQRAKALTDSLTGLPNRRALYECLETPECARSLFGHPVSVLFFDLDRFKSVNDTFGHEMGDRVIKLFAETMSSCLKGNRLIARMGGEEFAAVLPGIDREQAVAAAESVRAAFKEAAVMVDGVAIGITVSAGVASNGDTGIGYNSSKIEALFRRADAALYVAKSAGRNRVEYAQCSEDDAGVASRSNVRAATRRSAGEPAQPRRKASPKRSPPLRILGSA